MNKTFLFIALLLAAGVSAQEKVETITETYTVSTPSDKSADVTAKDRKKLKQHKTSSEHRQRKIHFAEKDVEKTKSKINAARKKLEKETRRLEKGQSKGKLTDIEIMERKVRISEINVKIHKLQKKLEKQQEVLTN